MDCRRIEEYLSEYMESSLETADQDYVTKHLETCSTCSALFEEMQSAVALCRRYTNLEISPELVDKILLRTSGRPRTRSFREILEQNFLRPLFTPRFAAGAGLAALFLIMVTHLLLPRIPAALSALSPKEVLGLMDRGVQQLYGEGLRAYEKKNEWQAQLIFFKNNLFNRLNSVIEQLDAPVEGKNRSGERWKQQQKAPGDESSGLLSSPV